MASEIAHLQVVWVYRKAYSLNRLDNPVLKQDSSIRWGVFFSDFEFFKPPKMQSSIAKMRFPPWSKSLFSGWTSRSKRKSQHESFVTHITKIHKFNHLASFIACFASLKSTHIGADSDMTQQIIIHKTHGFICPDFSLSSRHLWKSRLIRCARVLTPWRFNTAMRHFLWHSASSFHSPCKKRMTFLHLIHLLHAIDNSTLRAFLTLRSLCFHPFCNHSLWRLSSVAGQSSLC